MNDFSIKAIRHLESALKSQPDHLPSVVALCEVNFKQKNFSKARSVIDSALQQFDANATLCFWDAKIKHSQGKSIEASIAIDQAIAIECNDPGYHFLSLDIHAQTGNIGKAKESLEKLIDLCPLNGEVHLKLAKLLSHPDDFHRAKLLFEISIELLPDQTEPLVSLAKLLYKGLQSSPDGSVISKPDFSACRHYLAKAIELDSSCPKALIQLAKIALDQKSPEEAQSHLSLCFKDPSTQAEAHFLCAKANLMADQQESAIVHLKKAAASKPKRAEANLLLGEIFLTRKDFPRAKTYCEKSIRFFKEDIIIDSESTKSLLEKSEFFQARTKAESIEGKRKSLSKAHLTLYHSLGKGKPNLKHSFLLSEALEMNPRDAGILHELGMLALEAGNQMEAKRHFMGALDADWHSDKTHKQLGLLEIEANERQKAILHLSVALDIDPKQKGIKKLLAELRNQ